ncbi:MAG: hypothetical protein OXC80_09910 [Gammaproteobacteria bacterium]|nr:hypothetical protein [Gammaproteobacteria bacterium]
MPDRKSHILIKGFEHREEFGSAVQGRSRPIPQQNRHQRGHSLLRQYDNVLINHAERRNPAGPPVTEKMEMYL